MCQWAVCQRYRELAGRFFPGSTRFTLLVLALLAGLGPPVKNGLRADSVRSGAALLQGIDVFRLPQGVAELDQAYQSFRQGHFDQALKQLEAAAASTPGLPPAKAMLATLFFSVNQVPQGRGLLEQAAAEAPDHPEIYVLFGKLALAENRFTDAHLAFEKAEALEAPQGLNDRQKRTLQLSCHEGIVTVAEARAHWEKARERLEQWLKQEPNSDSARQRLVRALFQLGQIKEAREALEQAAKDLPSLEPAAILLGRLYAQQGNLEKAEEWMDYAVKAEPKNPRVHLARAAWLLEQNRAEDARPHAEALAKLQPDSEDLRRLSGLIALHRKDYAEAEKQFQALLQDAPGDFFASNNLSRALAEQDDPNRRQRALQLAQVNARQYPNNPMALATLGWVQYRLGQVEEAEQSLRNAAQGQISSDIAFDLARVLAARGHTEDARKLIQIALDTPGEFLGRNEARQWLEQQGDQDAEPRP
ncbi:hypothetical protein BH23PLA1_BH23PLA1_11040 [soil metagenome]